MAAEATNSTEVPSKEASDHVCVDLSHGGALTAPSMEKDSSAPVS